MKAVLTARQMKQCDEYEMNSPGCSSQILMERAARAAMAVLLERYTPAHVRVVCGTGNNGGDGFALARFLMEEGVSVDVCLIGDGTRMSVECGRQAVLYAAYDGVTVAAVDAPLPAEGQLVLVDALFGIGLDRPVEGVYLEAITAINRIRSQARERGRIRVLALDLPSGLHADSGCVLGCAVRADVTVTFAMRKHGLMLYPARLVCGEVVCADIGIGLAGLDGDRVRAWMVDEHNVRLCMHRQAYSNKGTYGRVVIFAGSRGMSGAAVLAARAAYRAGAGLVEVVTEQSNRVIVQIAVPEAIVSDVATDTEAALRRADAVVIGCGIGQSDAARQTLQTVLRYCREERHVPLTIDADALNLIAATPSLWESVPQGAVLTPHPGEMARLCGCTVAQVTGELRRHAQTLSEAHDVVCVLKDAATVVVGGGVVFYPVSGNNGMATGGAGDVLAGILGAVFAAYGGDYERDPAYLAAVGSSLHAMAGNLAAARTGEHGLMASDIADAVGLALMPRA